MVCAVHKQHASPLCDSSPSYDSSPSCDSSPWHDTAGRCAAAVDRRKLGGIVFSDAQHMETLNSIVWPAIRDLARAKMRELAAAGTEVGLFVIFVCVRAGGLGRGSGR